MTRHLTEIPLADEPSSGAQPTLALRDLNVSSSRRGVLRGIAFSAVGVGALALGVGSAKQAAAEPGPGGLIGWDANDCSDAYPDGYDPQPDSGGTFKNTYAACFGSSMMGSEFAHAGGWFRHERVEVDDYVRQYTPLVGICGPGGDKNAWKWRTPDGKVYRCSDGNLTGIANGQEYNYFAIARAEVR